MSLKSPVDSISFNPVLAKVHGSIIGGVNRKNNELNIDQIKEVISRILANASNQSKPVIEVKREIFLFLLLNTELPWPKEMLLLNDNVSAVSSICGKLLQPAQLIDLIESVNLWESLFGCCSSLPENVGAVLVRTAFNIIKEKKAAAASSDDIPLWALWTGISNVAFLFPTLQGDVIQGFLNYCLRKDSSKAERRFHLLAVLSVTKTCLSRCLPRNQFFTTILKQETSDTETSVVFLPSSSVEQDVKSSLMLALKAILLDMDFEEWIQLCEVSSNDLMSWNGISGIWLKHDVPSHLQFMAAHLIYDIQQQLDKNTDEKSTNLLEPAVLAQFSREYDRVLELGLEDVGSDQLLDLLLAPDKDKLDAWKVDAYLGKLEEFLPGILEADKCVLVLIEYKHYFSIKLELIYTSITPLNIVKDSHKQLFLELASQASMETLTSLLQHVTDKIDSKDKITIDNDAFDTRFVEAINRSSGVSSDVGEEEGDSKEGGVAHHTAKKFIILAILDGERTVRRLVEEATLNAGQTQTIASILMYLDPVTCKEDSVTCNEDLVTSQEDFVTCNEDLVTCSEDPVTCRALEDGSVPEYLDSGCKRTLLGQLVAQAILQKRGKEQENGIKLFNFIRKRHTSISQQIYSACLQAIMPAFNSSQIGICFTFLELIVSCVETSLLRLKPACLDFSKALGCYLLSQSYLSTHLDSLRSILLFWIQAITTRSPGLPDDLSNHSLVKYLPQQLVGYFYGEAKEQHQHLLHLIQSYNHHQDTAKDYGPLTYEELRTQTITCLIFITKEEYSILYKVIQEGVKLMDDSESIPDPSRCLHIISDACQMLMKNQDLDQDLKRRVLIGYSSLYTSVIQGSNMGQLLALYKILIKDLFVLKDVVPEATPTNDFVDAHNLEETDSYSLLAPVWRSCQALVAELLQYQQKVVSINNEVDDVIKDVEAISEELENLEINSKEIKKVTDIWVKEDKDTNIEANKDMKVTNEEVNELMVDKEDTLKEMLVMLAILPACSQKQAIVRMVVNYLDKL